jgi:hypothetical protein
MFTQNSLEKLQAAVREIRSGRSPLWACLDRGINANLLLAHADVIRSAAIDASIPMAEKLEPSYKSLIYLLDALQACEDSVFQAFCDHLIVPQPA